MCGFAHGEEEIGMPLDAYGSGMLDGAAPTPAAAICAGGVFEDMNAYVDDGGLVMGDEFLQEGLLDDVGQPFEPLASAPVELGVGAPQQRKRTLCKFWQEGNCQKGALCGFAHGMEELG